MAKVHNFTNDHNIPTKSVMQVHCTLAPPQERIINGEKCWYSDYGKIVAFDFLEGTVTCAVADDALFSIIAHCNVIHYPDIAVYIFTLHYIPFLSISFFSSDLPYCSRLRTATGDIPIMSAISFAL